MSSTTAKWYIVQAYSGNESFVVREINDLIEKRDLSDKITDVFIPTETFVEVKNGSKLNKTRNYFPGYVFVKMAMEDNLFYLIRNLPKVSGFVGMNGNPTEISEAEIEKIVRKTRECSDNPVNNIKYEIGEQVKVIDGPFASFSGTIEKVDENKQKLKVSVTIFGRATPVSLDFVQVERI